jgi:Zn-dependent peptidase ImmA (M78 family)
MTLRHGFKADAERRAVELRRQLQLAPRDYARPEKLADAASVTIVDADRLIDRRRLEELEHIQAFAFSACTFDIGGRRIIVTNPLRSGGRRNSDIAHELAHILLNHELAEVRDIAGTHFRTCEPGEEEEATALGGTLLLPRPLLYQAVRAGMDTTQIADHYNVTVDMARYRLNTTGVERQLRAQGR